MLRTQLADNITSEGGVRGIRPRQITYGTVVWQLKVENNITAGMGASKGHCSVQVKSEGGGFNPEKSNLMSHGAIQLN